MQVFLDDNLEDFIQVNSMTLILSIVRYLIRRSFFNQLRQSAQWDIFNIIFILETTLVNFLLLNKQMNLNDDDVYPINNWNIVDNANAILVDIELMNRTSH